MCVDVYVCMIKKCTYRPAGRLLLDKPRAALLRVVCLSPLTTRDRAGREWCPVPRDAHVHNQCVAEERHESSGAAASPGLAT